MLVPVLGEVDQPSPPECSHDVPKLRMGLATIQVWVSVLRDYPKKGFDPMSIEKV
jgi:hypothetical protein